MEYVQMYRKKEVPTQGKKKKKCNRSVFTGFGVTFISQKDYPIHKTCSGNGQTKTDDISYWSAGIYFGLPIPMGDPTSTGRSDREKKFIIVP